ncbi:hypothetical protein [Ideonella sp.]|uniref:hypothetical protein n=1 Tax=Ideonella sp. TaxID=1929293 RepID=UPI0035AE5B56
MSAAPPAGRPRGPGWARLAGYCVPPAWRDDVVADVLEQRGTRSLAWVAWQLACIGTRWRGALAAEPDHRAGVLAWGAATAAVLLAMPLAAGFAQAGAVVFTGTPWAPWSAWPDAPAASGAVAAGLVLGWAPGLDPAARAARPLLAAPAGVGAAALAGNVPAGVACGLALWLCAAAAARVRDTPDANRHSP